MYWFVLFGGLLFGYDVVFVGGILLMFERMLVLSVVV